MLVFTSNNPDVPLPMLSQSASSLDSIAVSVFVVILVDFDKYWNWDEQACLVESLKKIRLKANLPQTAIMRS